MPSRQGTPNAPCYPTRAHPNGHTMVQPALTRATALVSIVRDQSADDVARILDPLDRQRLYALVVVLAALVPDDQSVADLTAWVHDKAVRHVLRSAG